MTKTSIGIILLFLLSEPLLAQENPLIPRTVFKVSPQHFIESTLQLGVERFNATYSKSISVSVGLTGQGTGNDSKRGLGGDVQYRKYLKPVAERTNRKGKSYTQGIYFGPFVGAGYFRVREFDDGGYFSPYTGQYVYNSNPTVHDQIVHQVAGGFTFGVQRIFWDVIMVDVFMGGGVKLCAIDELPYPRAQHYYTLTDPGYSGIFPRIGVKVGIGL